MIFGHTVKIPHNGNGYPIPPNLSCTGAQTPSVCHLKLRYSSVANFFVQLRASRFQPKHKTQFILVQNDLRQWIKQSLNNTVPISPDL